jgi:hypothetical protein
MKIKVYRTINLPVVAYWCETWALTWRKEHRLRMFENRMLRKIFGPRGKKYREAGERCIMRSFMIATPQQLLFDILFTVIPH